jgi:hypothetical protein
MRASIAISAGATTFGAGLFEAALLAHAESAPVLLVAYDIAACGPLLDLIACRSRFAAAFVIAPDPARAYARVRLHRRESAAQLAPEPSVLHANHRDNPAARSLPLLAALARGHATMVPVGAAPQLALDMEISF